LVFERRGEEDRKKGCLEKLTSVSGPKINELNSGPFSALIACANEATVGN